MIKRSLSITALLPVSRYASNQHNYGTSENRGVSLRKPITESIAGRIN